MANRRGAGEGSLAKNATTGLWEVRIELPSDPLTGAELGMGEAAPADQQDKARRNS